MARPHLLLLLIKTVLTIVVLIPLGQCIAIYKHFFTSHRRKMADFAATFPSLVQAEVDKLREQCQKKVIKDSVQSTFFKLANGITLHGVVAGPQDGPLCVLLHGFPEGWACWRKVLPLLADAGYRVLAPDLRGYGLSDKPIGTAAYRVATLVQDVRDLIKAAGRDHCVLIAHDWGAGLGWAFAAAHPEMVRKMVIVDGPRIEALRKTMYTSLRQLLNSWYVLYFQVPLIPEFGMSSDLRVIFKGIAADAGREAYEPRDLDYYVASFSQPYSLTAAMNYYRAAAQLGTGLPTVPMQTSTLVIWGANDKYLEPHIIYALEDRLQPGLEKVVILPTLSHWIPMQAPNALVAHAVDYFKVIKSNH